MTATHTHSPFLAAARGDIPSRRPIWIMRQAGRYLPEYRAVRERRSFLEMCCDPEAAAEVTLQPLRRYDLDAAILFTDLLIPLLPMDLGLRYQPGPVLSNTVRSMADVERLAIPDPERDLAPMLHTAELVRGELAADKALIGFVGAPFTMACYMIEGRGSKNWDDTRILMQREPEVFDALQDKIVAVLVPLVRSLVAHGCDAVQVFDSWASVVGAGDWAVRCAPRTERLLQAARDAGAIAINYVNGASQHITAMAKSCADVLAVDWRTPLAELSDRVPADKTLQGNLDPTVLFAPEAELRRQVRAICDAVPKQRHIFNLGHGIHRTTDPEAVRILIDEVRQPT